jgi:hypothetical protein
VAIPFLFSEDRVSANIYEKSKEHLKMLKTTSGTSLQRPLAPFAVNADRQLQMPDKISQTKEN